MKVKVKEAVPEIVTAVDLKEVRPNVFEAIINKTADGFVYKMIFDENEDKVTYQKMPELIYHKAGKIVHWEKDLPKTKNARQRLANSIFNGKKISVISEMVDFVAKEAIESKVSTNDDILILCKNYADTVTKNGQLTHVKELINKNRVEIFKAIKNRVLNKNSFPDVPVVPTV